MTKPFLPLTNEAFRDLFERDPQKAVAYVHSALHAGENEAGQQATQMLVYLHRGLIRYVVSAKTPEELVDEVADGAITEAVNAVLKNPPDLIITDVNMPHMDGYQFVEALKADKSLPKIPVIFLTSMDEFDRGQQLGAVGYITKPVRADKLLAVVAEHLPGGTYPIG